MPLALLTATPAFPAFLPRCKAYRGTAQLYLRNRQRCTPSPCPCLAPALPTPEAAPRRLRKAGLAMSYPRSLDSHSADGQKSIATAAERCGEGRAWPASFLPRQLVPPAHVNSN